jgi:hypothetical protein
MNRKQILRERAAADLEAVDPKPHSLLGVSRPLSLREQIQQYVRGQVSLAAQAAGYGSFEEENDFAEPDDEPDLFSPHELRAMTPEGPPDSLDGQEPSSPEATKAAEPPA